MRTVLAVAVMGLVLSGCAGGPLTPRERTTLGGTVLGAGTGAIIGRAVGDTRNGALIGAGLGAVTGAVVGNAIQGARPTASMPPAPPAPPPAPILSYGAGDPTRGVFVNRTPWQVAGEVDGVPFALMPGEARPGVLDIGPHRVRAWAEVQTQLGPRTVGWVEQTFIVDARGAGWTVHFGRWDFR